MLLLLSIDERERTALHMVYQETIKDEPAD